MIEAMIEGMLYMCSRYFIASHTVRGVSSSMIKVKQVLGI